MNYTEELLRSSFIEDCRQTLPRHRGKSWDKRDPSKIRGMVLHQSLEEYGRASGVARYHVGNSHISSSGLPSLSYTLFIEKDGTVALANDVEDKTWSQGYVDPNWVDENLLYMGVCVGGNFFGPGYRGTQAPTSDQMDSVARLWGVCKGLWAGFELYGHYHFGKPACPGYELTDYIYSQRPSKLSSIVDRQTALARLGYYKGKVDGKWGPDSKEALVNFQSSSGLNVDGVWGPITSAAVISALSRM